MSRTKFNPALPTHSLDELPGLTAEVKATITAVMTPLIAEDRPICLFDLSTKTFMKLVELFDEDIAMQIEIALHNAGLAIRPTPADLKEVGLSLLARSELQRYAGIATLPHLLAIDKQTLTEVYRISLATIGEIERQFDIVGLSLKERP